MINFVFNSKGRENYGEIAKIIKQYYNYDVPVIICVGSDLVVGDSLGPIVGSSLVKLLQGKAYVYGTLTSPVTASEVPIIYDKIKRLHPRSKTIVIDAAVGNKEDIGLIKIYTDGIKPGLGVNKNLPKIGDLSIIGIVGDKNESLSGVRLNLVSLLSRDIINGLCLAFTK